jgi:hypothetical protein
MSPSRRVRAGVCALLSTGLAMSSLGLRQALADGTAPAPLGASAQVTVAASPGATVSAGVSSGSVSAGAALPAGISASAGAASSGLPPASAGISTVVSAPAPVGSAVGTGAIGPGTPPGPSLANAQPSAMGLPGSPGTALALDPTFGPAAGGAGTAGPTGPGAPQQAAADSPAGVRATAQDAPVICSQLVFRPLVSGCKALLGPIGGGGLAATGTPLLTGLAGALLILVGGLILWRNRRPTRTANGADGTPGERRSVRVNA